MDEETNKPYLWSPLVITLRLYIQCPAIIPPITHLLSFCHLWILCYQKLIYEVTFQSRQKTNFRVTDKNPLTENIVNYDAMVNREWLIQFQDVKVSTNWQINEQQAWALNVTCQLLWLASHDIKMFRLNGAFISLLIQINHKYSSNNWHTIDHRPHTKIQALIKDYRQNTPQKTNPCFCIHHLHSLGTSHLVLSSYCHIDSWHKFICTLYQNPRHPISFQSIKI
jgi:hypothetical protein